MADTDVAIRFAAHLRDQRLPVTPQRLAIAETLERTAGHLSAEDVVAALAERGNTVGLATVYRTLDLLVAYGLAEARDFGEGFTRYEGKRLLPNQYQLTCALCGAVIEFYDARIPDIIRQTAMRHGFVQDQHRLHVSGTCRACRKTPHAPARRSS